MGVKKIKTEQRFHVKFAYNITATKLNTWKHVLGQNKQHEPQRRRYIHIWSCLCHLTIMGATEFTSGSYWYLCCLIFNFLRSVLSTIVFLFFYFAIELFVLLRCMALCPTVWCILLAMMITLSTGQTLIFVLAYGWFYSLSVPCRGVGSVSKGSMQALPITLWGWPQ